MTRRSILHRMLAVGCSAWIALSGAVRGASSGCAMHDVTQTGHAGHAGHAGATTEHRPPVSHAHGVAHHHTAPSRQAPHDAHPCSCVGDCCGVPAVWAIGAAAYIAPHALVLVDEPRPLPSAPAATTRRHVLPFANGPPLARVA